MQRLVPGAAASLALLALCAAAPAATVEHHLSVQLRPQAGRLEATDTVTVPARAVRAGGSVDFVLSRELEILESDPPARPAPGAPPMGRMRLWRVTLPEGARSFTLRYAGSLQVPPAERGTGLRGAAPTGAALVSERGVYLDGASGWYPRLGDGLLRFRMTVRAPPGWTAVSQGARTRLDGGAVRWAEPRPQDDIYLLAGRFHEYSRAGPAAEAQVFLREADAALAERYLAATERYLALYSGLLGDYPYAKFALVENFWESGFGMPSFTLLGSRVIRLPFIVHTSYPHEILHNWWGNGVYVDFSGGNWSEGLTAYLADHLLRERRGEGAEYRRGALQKYADYVRGARDFPLTAFRGRHDEASQAVGYHKTLMVLHMLRLRLGDDAFLAALRRFYADHRFRAAAWADLRRAFEQASGEDLGGFFAQWLTRTGAPVLELGEITAGRTGEGWRLGFTLAQTQAGEPYALGVPVAVTLEGAAQARPFVVDLDARERRFALDLPARPLRLDVDPAFDLFRRLAPGERPPTLGGVFGAERVAIVVPGSAPAELRAAYGELARAWAEGAPGVEVLTDGELEALPGDRAVLVLGWENRLREAVQGAAGQGALAASQAEVRLAGTALDRDGHAVAVAARCAERPCGFVATAQAGALAALARKLPHYSRYGYVAFAGAAARNVLKGEWPVTDSPLAAVLDPAAADRAPVLPARPPLDAALSR